MKNVIALLVLFAAPAFAQLDLPPSDQPVEDQLYILYENDVELRRRFDSLQARSIAERRELSAEGIAARDRFERTAEGFRGSQIWFGIFIIVGLVGLYFLLFWNVKNEITTVTEKIQALEKNVANVASNNIHALEAITEIAKKEVVVFTALKELAKDDERLRKIIHASPEDDEEEA